MIELFNKLLEVRDISHQIHLSKVDIGYHHEALGDFYEGLLDSFDSLVEVYQGQYGLVDDFGLFEEVDFSDHVKYYTDFANYVQSKRGEIKEEAVHLNAIIDDIMIMTYKLLYKLKNLK